MKQYFPKRLFGRIYRKPIHPEKARLRAMWKTSIPMPPDVFDVDSTIAFSLPPRMWLNDAEGDCVIAARANHTLRMVARDIGELINITDAEVQTEYMSETGGQDTGLVPEDSFNLWQSRGWNAGGKTRTIAAWGRTDASDQLDVKRTIFLLGGLQLSFSLPNIWQDAINMGQSWDAPTDVDDPDSQPGSWGGHQVYASKYDTNGVYVWTWGQQQLITWSGLAYYGSMVNQGEACGIVRTNEVGIDPADHLDMTTLLSDLAIVANG